MTKRIFATLLFIALHSGFYLLFRGHLQGSAFALALYGCTVLSFVIIRTLFFKNRGRKHE